MADLDGKGGDGSQVPPGFVLIPKFYMRLGHEDSPGFDKMGVMTIEFISPEQYGSLDEKERTAGWHLPRAFQEEEDGFWIASEQRTYTKDGG